MYAYNKSGHEIDIIYLHKFNPLLTPLRVTKGYNIFS